MVFNPQRIAVLILLSACPTGLGYAQRIQLPRKLPLNVASAWDSAPQGGGASLSGQTASNGSLPPSAWEASQTPITTSPRVEAGTTGGRASVNFVPPDPTHTRAPVIFPSNGGVISPHSGNPNYAPGDYLGPDSGLGPGRIPTFRGGTLPPTGWDPYGGTQPGSSGSSPWFPRDPNLPSGRFSTRDTMTTVQSFLNTATLDYVWMPGNGQEDLGQHDADLSATFNIPFPLVDQAPLMVTPGFGVQYWNGPSDGRFDMPSRTYDAYLDVGWMPQLNESVGADLGARIGVYSDFRRITSDSIRLQGHGKFIVSLTPSLELQGGVIYLDRLRVKLLPTGGFVWRPADNPNLTVEAIFPTPRVSIAMGTDTHNRDWLFYLRGEYGGDSWTVRRRGPFATFDDRVDYNDLRAAVGMGWNQTGGGTGHVEVGLAFERELYYDSRVPERRFQPNATVFLGGNIAY